MDTSYYFVLEPNGIDDGPYRLLEIQKRVDVGLISRGASLCRTGDTTYVPLADPRFAEVLQPPRRPAMGTAQVPVMPVAAVPVDVAAPILAFPDKTAEQVGADGSYCKTSHNADRIVAIKLEGENLTFIRTDGNAYPETVQLRKDTTAAAPTPAPASAQ